MEKDFDVVIIGAGMSGLAAGIRLAMFDQKVCILESHSIPGGLNSYYQRGKRKFDVGLHAMTNWTAKGSKGKPLSKLMKQLRIPYDQFQLIPQKQSSIRFPEHKLIFTNNIEDLIDEIQTSFPHQIDGFKKLIHFVERYDETNLKNTYTSAKKIVESFINDKTLLNMIFCPLMIYGSAWEHDMDFSQFAIMFKSIFLEGLARPSGGVRTIINLLSEKLEQQGLLVQYKSQVKKLHKDEHGITGLTLTSGAKITCRKVLSSAGYRETLNLFESKQEEDSRVTIGKMSFTESILILDKKPKEFGIEDAIIFANNSHDYNYRNPKKLFDSNSAVLCFPNNFMIDEEEEGIYRSTMMADYDCWNKLDRAEYLRSKKNVLNTSIELFHQHSNTQIQNVLFSDIFTPKTVKRYTHHENGCVYGSPEKSRDGTTSVNGLYLMGTDQGFLGIVGAMLSGISMANYHCLRS
jgi:phytoene dehydrogenase-like protein